MHHLPHDTSTEPRRIVAAAGKVGNLFILPNTQHVMPACCQWRLTIQRAWNRTKPMLLS